MNRATSGRRAFLQHLVLGGLAMAGAKALGAQGAPQDLPGGGESGKLFNPGAVQRRAPTVGADNDAFIMQVEKTLKCQCGCNLDIYTCRTTDFTCTTSPALHRDVVALRAQGMTAAQIREDFVQQYGEQALMAPKPEGFNLAGDFVPGILMLLGIGALSAWLLRRQRLVAAAPAGLRTPLPNGDVGGVGSPTPAELERLRRALSRVDD